MLRYLAITIILLLSLSPIETGKVLAADLSTEDVMARVLLDQNAADDVKLANAKVLMSSSAGCEKLAGILNAQNHIEAKKLICEVLSNANSEGLFIANNNISDIFIDPLFKCLYSADSQLSSIAALALAECFPGKTLYRLPGSVISGNEDLEFCLAAIAAIENISGREALLTLAELLKDERPEIKKRTAQAICQRIMLDFDQFEPNYFTLVELPKIREMTDVEFLMFQTRNLSRKNKLLTFEGKSLEQQMNYWQQKYLRSETDRFNSLSPANKLVMLEDKLNISQEYAVRQWAARLLVTWSNSANAREGDVARDLIKLLGELITDDQDFVRVAVAEVLGVLGYKAGTEPLIQQLLVQLEGEQSTQCLRAILGTLGQLQYNPAFEHCLKVWETNKDNDIAAAAISAAGKISAKISAEESSRIKLLVDSITSNYKKSSNSPVLRIAVFQAIKKIVEDENWHSLAAEPFGKLIADGLADKLADVRSLAVYSHIALLKEQSLEMLISTNMLSDQEASVRFAVIEAVDNYGSAEYLDILKDRLEHEQSSDVKARLQETMVNILTSMQVEDVYNWIFNLKNGTETIRMLKLQAITILGEKVSALKTATGTIEPKYEIAILDFSVNDYLSKQQYEQAAQAMVDLLNSKVSDGKRVEICNKFFSFIFDDTIDYSTRAKSIDILQVAVGEVLRGHENILTIFQNKYQAYADNTTDSELTRARILKQLIFFAGSSSTQEFQVNEFWISQGSKLADIIADNILSGNLELDQNIIALLKTLDTRFVDLPQEPQARIDFIKQLKAPEPAPNTVQ